MAASIGFNTSVSNDPTFNPAKSQYQVLIQMRDIAKDRALDSLYYSTLQIMCIYAGDHIDGEKTAADCVVELLRDSFDRKPFISDDKRANVFDLCLKRLVEKDFKSQTQAIYQLAVDHSVFQDHPVVAEQWKRHFNEQK